jgi:hypothetical protein
LGVERKEKRGTTTRIIEGANITIRIVVRAAIQREREKIPEREV